MKKKCKIEDLVRIILFFELFPNFSANLCDFPERSENLNGNALLVVEKSQSEHKFSIIFGKSSSPKHEPVRIILFFELFPNFNANLCYCPERSENLKGNALLVVEKSQIVDYV